ncbi:MAG: stage V sporulation protein SpoVM [Turicibacter sp.]|nr:stage V sporulation protein SpoVM [Turicibacter sp.]
MNKGADKMRFYTIKLPKWISSIVVAIMNIFKKR